MKKFSDLKLPETEIERKVFVGEKIGIFKIINRAIVVHDYKIEDSKFEGKGKCLHMQIAIGDTKKVVFTAGKKLMETITNIEKDDFPFSTVIVELDNKLLVFS